VSGSWTVGRCASKQLTLTSRGRVTIPKAVREQLALRKGTRLVVTAERDHGVLRLAVPHSGFGMARVQGAGVAPDFDVARLVAPEAPRRRPTP